MRSFLVCLLVLVGGTAAGAYAGVIVGGNPGLMQQTAEAVVKLYADADDYRRAEARLAVRDVETVSVKLKDGEAIEARKLDGSIITADSPSREILPVEPAGE